MPPPKRPPAKLAIEHNPLTPAQWRMARAALEITQNKLAKQANVPLSMIKRLETGQIVVPWMVRDVRDVLEVAGVEFIAENRGGAGVRLRKMAPKPTASQDKSKD